MYLAPSFTGGCRFMLGSRFTYDCALCLRRPCPSDENLRIKKDRAEVRRERKSEITSALLYAYLTNLIRELHSF